MNRRQSDGRGHCSSGDSNILLQVGNQAANSYYQIECNTSLPGGNITQKPSSSFDDCMNQCSSNATCSGVSYDITSRNCVILGSVDAVRPNVRGNLAAAASPWDSAIRLKQTGPANDCPTISTQQPVKVNDTSYNTYCGRDFPTLDLGGNYSYHAASMKECMGYCTLRSECAGVTYATNLAYSTGYWNCYLKGSVNTRGLVNLTGADTAFLVQLGSVLSTSSTPSSSSTTSSTSTARPSGKPQPSKMSGGKIAGIVVGALIAVAILVSLLLILKRKRHAAHHKGEQAEDEGLEVYDPKLVSQPSMTVTPVDPQELAEHRMRAELHGQGRPVEAGD